MTVTNQRVLEIFLIIIAISISCLLHESVSHKLIILNLFYLPIVLGGFFLGRYRAGVLAAFCVVSAFVVAVLDFQGFAGYTSPVVVGLAILLWGAVLGLTAILVGTLSDERSEKIYELQDAYVGVVEVLSRYLQNANPEQDASTNRLADLSQKVAVELNLTPQEVDEVRVAALLHDIENIEVTSRVLSKAVVNSEAGQDEEDIEQHTFQGTQLVQSIGAVLNGALPLVIEQHDEQHVQPAADESAVSDDVPFGVKILHTVRAYEALRQSEWGQAGMTSQEAIDELRQDSYTHYDPLVLAALESVVTAQDDSGVVFPSKAPRPAVEQGYDALPIGAQEQQPELVS